MAKRYCGYGFASERRVTQCSSSALTVTAATATAANIAASEPVASSAGAPTSVTSKVPKDGSIIVTGSVITGAAAVKRYRA